MNLFDEIAYVCQMVIKESNTVKFPQVVVDMPTNRISINIREAKEFMTFYNNLTKGEKK